MSEPFIAMIVQFGGNFAPRGWAFCQGQILSIAQNTALFSLLGTTYGGNGQTTFALPDTRGRVMVGTGQGPGLPSMDLGQMGGEATHTLTINEMPIHIHNSTVSATTAKSTLQAPGASAMLGKTVDKSDVGSIPVIYAPSGTTPVTDLGGVNNAAAGGSQPHSLMQPYLGMNNIIALEGIFPSRN